MLGMRMRSVCLMLPALLLLPAAAQANDLLKIYQEARDNDAQLQAAEHARDAGIEARPIARGDLLPQITGSAAESREHDKISSDSLGIDPTTGLPIAGSATRNSSPWSYGITLTQTVFSWQQISALRQAGDEAALAELTYRSAEQDLRLRVAQAYFNVLAALDTLRS
ncbi:MAG TPA: TolC family protein, partial [Nevskiaceae bacterium]|nr:TolC family protein [Nevskiaceae bacterium]